MKEIWKDIPDYEGLYQVSNFGRVRSLDRVIKGRGGCIRFRHGVFLRPASYSNGYLFVSLSKDNIQKQIMIHRLVMKSFVGESDLDVNHKDGNKSNNRLDNLEYVTRHENQLHAFRVLHRQPVKSWEGKRGFEHNKSHAIIITNIESGEKLTFGSLRLAGDDGFNRNRLAKCIKNQSLYNDKYKVQYYG